MAIGTTGKYERLDVLGHGTSGVVYLAWDTMLRRQVALKEIRAAAPEMERVLQEARVLDRLRHPHIVHVNGVDVDNGAVLIDMELVRGRNLADLLREREGEPLPLGEALRITLAVLSALAYAHERRIIHRDVKPGNILVAQDGTIKLTDFGLAEALGSASVAGGGGTYPYMAPEDFAAEEASDKRSDLWAVGVVLYEMLAGRRPFVASRAKDPFAWMRAIQSEVPSPVSTLNSNVPPALDTVIETALAKNKADRFPAAEHFANALRESVAGVAMPAPSVAATVVTPRASVVPERAAASLPVFVFAGGAGTARRLDDWLVAAVTHWDEARDALLNGRAAGWLRNIGEVHIADLADELAGRRNENADARLREFLDRSGLDTKSEARRRARLAGEAARRGDLSARDALLAESRRLSGEGSVAAEATAAVEAAPLAPALPARKTGKGRWWFWPLLALCVGPPIVALGHRLPSGLDGRFHNLFEAWIVSGFLCAMLLLVGSGARLPALWRALCVVPVAFGLTAGFALLSSSGPFDASDIRTVDDLVRVAAFVLLPLAFLLVQIATATRLWRLWVFFVFALSLAATARFLAP